MGKRSIYFMGIGGTGMAAVAGLCQQAGFNVIGSDNPLYPPMSDMLKKLGISYLTPYNASNIPVPPPEKIVVANSLSRGHPEVEAMIERQIPYTSFPALLGEFFLEKRISIVVTGTHGKTTTTALITHMLKALGANPGYLIGGLPHGFEQSFDLGKGDLFVIEGDEYDTAFFDKNSKFHHYRPKIVVANNLEFDHADIFPDLGAIKIQFSKLFQSMAPQHLSANIDDQAIREILDDIGIGTLVSAVSARSPSASVKMQSAAPRSHDKHHLWSFVYKTQHWNEMTVDSSLMGIHNGWNIAQAINVIQILVNDYKFPKPEKSDLIAAIKSFQGVQRRLTLLGDVDGIEIYEDFAHHPTAVGLVLQSFRASYPNKRIIAAFEPRNATSRRNIFTNEYAKSLGFADRVYLGACPQDSRIPENSRMNTQVIANALGEKGLAFDSNDALLVRLTNDLRPGDSVIFMSSGGFSGIQHKILACLESRKTAPSVC